MSVCGKPEDVRSFEGGVMGNYEPFDMCVGIKLRASGSTGNIPNQWGISLAQFSYCLPLKWSYETLIEI